MKKIASLITMLALACASLSAQSIKLDFNAGYFYSSASDASTNNFAKSGTVLFVSDVSGTGFNNLKLDVGSSLQSNSFLNSGSDYFVLGVSNIISNSLSIDYGMVGGSFTFDLGATLKPGQEIGIIFLPDVVAQTSANVGDLYGVFTPSFVKEGDVDPNSHGVDWVVPAGVGAFNMQFYTQGPKGELNNLYGVADKTVSSVPEASTYALFFGFVCFAFVLVRRKVGK